MSFTKPTPVRALEACDFNIERHTDADRCCSATCRHHRHEGVRSSDPVVPQKTCRRGRSSAREQSLLRRFFDKACHRQRLRDHDHVGGAFHDDRVLRAGPLSHEAKRLGRNVLVAVTIDKVRR